MAKKSLKKLHIIIPISIIVAVIGISWVLFEKKWQTFSEIYPNISFTFQLPRDWHRLPQGWNKNSPTHLYDLNGYVSSVSYAYNQGLICPTHPTGGRSCQPHDPQYDLTIWDIYTSSTDSMPSLKIGGEIFYEVNSQSWAHQERVEYAIKADTCCLGDAHYYVLSFDKNLDPNLIVKILESFSGIKIISP